MVKNCVYFTSEICGQDVGCVSLRSCCLSPGRWSPQLLPCAAVGSGGLPRGPQGIRRPRGSVGRPPPSHADADTASRQARGPPPSHRREELEALSRKLWELERRKKEEEDEAVVLAPEVRLPVFSPPAQHGEAAGP